MVALFVQTLLLMGAAYFLGAAAACLIRRSLFARAAQPGAVERRVDPLPGVAARPAGFAEAAALRQPPLAPPPVAPTLVETEPAQDLKRIALIDAALEAGLNKLGVHRYDQIAGWMQGDVKRIAGALRLADRIARENWIEQAQVLAKGGETYYARRRARGEAANAGPTPDEGERRPLTATAAAPAIIVSPRASTGGAAGVAVDVSTAVIAATASTPDVSERAAFAGNLAAASAPMGVVPVRPVPPIRDNLQRIGGVDAGIEQLLIAQGVTRYSQIAHWSPADVERFDRQLGVGGRIARENWIEQAQILSRGGDTTFSRSFDRRTNGADVPAVRPAMLGDAACVTPPAAIEQPGRTVRSDIGVLRSVRSQAYQNMDPGPEAAQHAAAQNKVLRSGGLDDLKRIRGIGVLIEKKLNSMGVSSYEQIANWSAQDIDRVSQSLDFKGRIERENWVEQARILASGGATEFSRRVDRGEVETSRAKT